VNRFFAHTEITATLSAVSQVRIAAAGANSLAILPVLDTYLKVERILAWRIVTDKAGL
jgi:hypothetical protein